MLQEVLQDDDFLKVSSARRLVNISGTVKATDLTFLQVKDMGLDAPGSPDARGSHHAPGSPGG
jgi:hypothetical protein